MKITNDRLGDINYNALMGDDSQLAETEQDEILSITDELQQLRAAQHERRWRKIADEGLPYDMDVQVCNAESGHLYEFNKGAVKKNRRWIASFATHWRPQDTDLPEEKL